MTGKKTLVCQVILLDERVPSFTVQWKAIGIDLYDLVFKELQLVESDYFGLEYRTVDNVDNWLDKEKPILQQVVSDHNVSFKFRVKFYTPDPTLLEDEFTRYQFALQIRQDLATGRLQCNTNTSALLSAYIAQSELGDFQPGDYTDHTYLKCISFVPHQTEELEKRIMEYHRTFIGQPPSEADFNLLDTARKTDFYGVILHAAKDHEDVSLHLAVIEAGILVFQNNQRINTFSWVKIRKLSFRRKRFIIKLHPAVEPVHYKDLVEFMFSSRNRAKAFWKNCVEHHSFFRCHEVRRIQRNRHPLLSRGSSFRYTGRTQLQLLDHVKDNVVKGRTFTRTMSLRASSSSSHHYSTSYSATLGFKQPPSDTDEHLSQGSHNLQEAEEKSRNQSSAAAAMMEQPKGLPKDRNYSAPILNAVTKHGQLTVTGGGDAEQHKLSRSPDYQNIPEKLEHPNGNEGSLKRTCEFNDIPEELPDENYKPTPHSGQFDETKHRVDEASCIPSSPIASVQSESDMLKGYMHSRTSAVAPATSTNGTLESNLSSKRPTELNAHSSSLEALPTIIPNGTSDADVKKADHDSKKKRLPSDKAFYIVKELVMTERTYHKDLEILTRWFRKFMAGETASEKILWRLFNLLDPIYDAHVGFLQDLEQRLILWEGKVQASELGDAQRIGDLLLRHDQQLALYKDYLDHLEGLLMELSNCAQSNRELNKRLQEFETEKVCYLPVYCMLLKPAHRVLHYESILARLLSHYQPSSPDYKDCKNASTNIVELLGKYRSVIAEVENLEKLTELQQDVVGIDGLVQQGRYFIREGCLQKLSRKGYQQRLFLLLSDVLLYTSRTSSSLLQFKVHSQLPLSGMTIEETDPKTGVAHSFSVCSGNRCIIVAATSQEEKDKWLEDLNFAISIALSNPEPDSALPQLTSSLTGATSEADLAESTNSPERDAAQQHKANTTMHVCWHRNTSVSIKDLQSAIKHQLSGFLLRKFKNSNGWQKLWVVFTNFCLFFYKNNEDDAPLASLPLLGYSVSSPSASDGILKDHVFKLLFKNHVYFFRAESDYTFHRWFEVINSATQSARRTRTFSRMDSVQS